MTSVLLFWILVGQTSPSEAHILKTFYLRAGTSLTQSITTLRQRLDLKYAIPNTGVNGITVRETPERIAQVENILAGDLRGSSATLAVNSDRQPDEVHLIETFYLGDSATQLDLVEISTALPTLLDVARVATNGNAKAIIIRDTPTQIALASKVITDLARPDTADQVRASASIDAGKASEFSRRDRGGMERQISLRNVHSEEGVSEIVVGLRTLLNNPLVEAKAKTIVVRDTENNLLLAERIVADLDKPSQQ